MESYRVIWMSDSNSVAKWRRIMFFDVGMPIAVAMTSALKVGSRMTKAPWIPLSIFFYNFIHRNKCSDVRTYGDKIVFVFIIIPLKLSAYSAKSMPRAQLIKRWLVHTRGSQSITSHCLRLSLMACRSYLIIRRKVMPCTIDVWWALRVTPKCFSNSRLVKLSSSRASIKQVWKESAYWITDNNSIKDVIHLSLACDLILYLSESDVGEPFIWDPRIPKCW
jgi:hypothetical protein